MKNLFVIWSVLGVASFWSCRPQPEGSQAKESSNPYDTRTTLDQKSKLNGFDGNWEWACTGKVQDRTSEKVTIQISSGTIVAKTSFYGYDSNCSGKVAWEELATSKLVLEGPSSVVNGATNLVSTLQGIDKTPLDELAVSYYNKIEPSKTWALNVPTKFSPTEDAKQPAYSLMKIVEGRLCFGIDLDILPSTPEMRPKSLEPLANCGVKK